MNASPAQLASDPPSTTIRLFLSSTFADFQTERDVLQRDVFPSLRALCAQSGYRLEPIDLRWGVTEEAALDRRTLTICRDELERCRTLSPDCFLLILLGNRYGSHVLPPDVPADVVALLLPHLTAEERLTFDAAYRRDDNAVPPHYVLQRAEGPERTEDEVLRLALVRAGRATGLPFADRLPVEATATHREIHLGLLGRPPDPAHDSGVLCAVRSFVGQPQGPQLERFVEHDPERGAQMQHLTEHVVGRLPDEQALRYTVVWPDAHGPAFDEAMLAERYLGLLQPKLEAVIAARSQARTVAAAQGRDETALTNEAFERQRAAYVAGREAELDRLAAYLQGRASQGLPLIVTGPSGSGKSALLAESVKRAAATLPQAVLVVRYIGVTPSTGSLSELLTDLRRAIALAYGRPEPVTLTDEAALRSAVARELAAGEGAPERPLLLVLDALDQLAETGVHTDWLPPRLAPHVRVVVSMPFDQPGLSALRARFPATQELTLGPLAPQACRGLLRTLLDAPPQRTLTPPQEEAALHAIAREGLPLYVRLLADEVRQWRSFDPPLLGTMPLPSTVSDLLATMLGRLESPSHHGPMLVAHALGDLAAARFGLAEDELLDLLARDQAVRDEQAALSPNSPPIDARLPLPASLWARLYREIEPLVSEREMDGVRLTIFYHQQMRATVRERYFGAAQRAPRGPETETGAQTQTALDRHRALVSYFAEQPWRLGPHLWNWRKVRELPLQQERAGDWDGADQTLASLAATLKQTLGTPPAPESTASDSPGTPVAQTLPAAGAPEDFPTTLALIEALRDRFDTGGHRHAGMHFHLIELAIARELGDRARQMRTLNDLGLIAAGMDRLSQALGYFEQALGLAEELGDREAEGRALSGLAALAGRMRHAGEARDYQLRALAIARELGDRIREGEILIDLGMNASGVKREAEAQDYLRQALAIAKEVGNREAEALALNNLGAVAERSGRWGAARTYYDQSLAMSREIGDRTGEALALGNIGLLVASQDRSKEARDILWQAVAIGEQVGAADLVAALHDRLAWLYMLHGSEWHDDELAHGGEQRAAPEPEPEPEPEPAQPGRRRSWWPFGRRGR